MEQLSKEAKNLILQKVRKIASNDRAEAAQASAEFIKAVQTPLRKTLLTGDTVGAIYVQDDRTDTRLVEYPLDLLTPTQEDDYYAYVIPGEGRIPERRVEGDYLAVPTYEVGNSIDCTLRFIRDANWNVVSRMMEVLEAGFIKKMNDDGWQTILAASVDRNLLINDASAAAGQFTPRLISLLKTFMRRNGGGNSATLGRSRLTDLYMSPEAHIDIQSWTLQEVSDEVRTRIYFSEDNAQDLVRVYGVNLHAYDEFGVGQEYQNYFSDVLGGSEATGDEEILVGLDLQNPDDSFVHPVVEELEIFEDNTVHRRNIFSMYGRREHGFAVLDNRRTLLASV